jgi:Protein of unknown function (DUF3072)
MKLSFPWENADSDPRMDPWQPAAAPMTAAQRTLLKALCARLKLPFDSGLDKAQALSRITELREVDERSAHTPQPEPDVVPPPPSPPPDDAPPEIIDPTFPGQHEPVGDPRRPSPPMRTLDEWWPARRDSNPRPPA